MKIYRGINYGAGPQQVSVMEITTGETYLLPHVYRHSSDGFQWGYGGSGPADLALSILADCYDEQTAHLHYQQFKWDFIEKASRELSILEEDIRKWMQERWRSGSWKVKPD